MLLLSRLRCLLLPADDTCVKTGSRLLLWGQGRNWRRAVRLTWVRSVSSQHRFKGSDLGRVTSRRLHGLTQQLLHAQSANRFGRLGRSTMRLRVGLRAVRLGLSAAERKLGRQRWARAERKHCTLGLGTHLRPVEVQNPLGDCRTNRTVVRCLARRLVSPTVRGGARRSRRLSSAQRGYLRHLRRLGHSLRLCCFRRGYHSLRCRRRRQLRFCQVLGCRVSYCRRGSSSSSFGGCDSCCSADWCRGLPAQRMASVRAGSLPEFELDLLR